MKINIIYKHIGCIISKQLKPRKYLNQKHSDPKENILDLKRYNNVKLYCI